MAITRKNLTYRGDLRAIVGYGKEIAFTSVHPDGVPTAVYRLDVEKLQLDAIPLPCGGLCLASSTLWQPEAPTPASGQTLWVGGDDGKLYQLKGKAKKPQPLEVQLPAAATAICSAGDRLAVLCDKALVIVDAEQGSELQSLELSEKGTAIAADPTGQWLAVGTSKGTVSVYEREDKDEFQLSESEKLHEGAVTAILFEPEELRFLSSGADQKLLLTHARGTLQAEDRGRGGNHKDIVTAMVHVPGERFVTVSRDESCKTWARAGASRPATFDDTVPAVVDAVVADVHQRPHLIIAGDDNSIRFILLDAGGRFSSMTHRLYDAYRRAANLLKETDISQRGDAIGALAQYDDTRSLEMLARQVDRDKDPGLRLRSAKLLAKSEHARAAKLLEPLLKHDDDEVRTEAFEGLRRASAKDDLRPLDLAIAAKRANIGVAAVKLLTKFAKKDDQALRLLIRSLDRDPVEVRHAALLELENVFDKKSPEPTLIASKSKESDTRRLALIRAFQRDMLADGRVAGTVRRAGEDEDPDVRRTAMLIAILSRANLAKAIRGRDSELHRQLFELENYQLQPDKSKKATQPPKQKATKVSLDVGDFQPLLSAMSSRMVDTCLLGARCLALLGDSRALGTLLQLSREESAGARVQVCQALAALEDSRAAQRLETMIDDKVAAVRDAAYSALEELHKKHPLDAADIGLSCGYIDVRRRALKTLIAGIRKAKSKADIARSQVMILRALNDDEISVSGEAFKSLLGSGSERSIEETLRFALQSVRVNVRREVLTEVMAADKQPWAQAMLVDLLNDSSPKIRDDAYQHLLDNTKQREIEPMQAALRSIHVDIRRRGTESLIKLNTKAAHQALAAATSDEDASVRKLATAALININDVQRLHQAMSSKYTDVRLQAACARALFHDEQAATPLLETATATEPEKDADKKQWEKDAVVALNGLGMLGQERFVPLLLPLLESRHAGIRLGAASAISRCARPAQVDSLKRALQHSDPKVRYRIALGLAFCREPIALPVVFSDEATKVLDRKDILMAIVAYGDQTEAQLVGMLDDDKPWIRNAAFVVLMFRDWRSHDGTPARILAALSASDPRIRLAAAEVLESFSDSDTFGELIVRLVNDRGEQQAWEIPAEKVAAMASLIVFGPPHCQGQSVTLLESLADERQEQWDFAWEIYSGRYAAEIESATEQAEQNPPPDPSSSADELRQLAFGTYVGLVREQGSYHERGARPAFGTTVIAARQAAIRRLVEMSEADESIAMATRSVLIQALSDPLQDVRMLAFQQLANSDVEDDQRAAAAIECGHTDLAVEALKLLTKAAGKKGRGVLEDVVRSRDDELATEAAKLLLQSTDVPTAAEVALQSPYGPTRTLSIAWLAGEYEKDDKAKKVLVQAYQSRFQSVQRDVAIALAEKKDAGAFEMLIEQLPVVLGVRNQGRILDAVVQLADPQSGDALLDALEADEEKSLDAAAVLDAIGALRGPQPVDRMLPLLEKKEWRDEVYRNVVKISGYDQYCRDPDDELPHRDWLDKQHPRDDHVLAGLLQTCLQLNLPDLIKPRIRDARWSLTSDVDDVLKLLAVHPDEDLRVRVIEAIGWRLRKRDGPADALLTALEHRDPTTKFIAAAGLARGGHSDGIQILLSGVELMSDLNLRMLGVRALGELADERSLDMLLRLASDDTHALQDMAAEAIGHLGKSEKAEEIFQLLKRLVSSGGSVSERAIVGLRWFNTPSAWDLIRAQADDPKMKEEHLDTIIEQLGYNDDPATKTILLESLKSDFAGDVALNAARRVFGEESLEPDYAILQSDLYYELTEVYEDQVRRCVKRVCNDGDAKKILQIMTDTMLVEELSAALMARDPLPLEAAGESLDSPHPEVVSLAASIVGRSQSKDYAKQLETAITTALEAWNESYQQALRDGGAYYAFYDLEPRTNLLARLAWVAGSTQSAKKQLVTLLESNQGNSRYVAVRRAAVLALDQFKLTGKDLAAIEALVEDADAEVRQTAARILAGHDPKRAGGLIEKMVLDRSLLRQVASREGIDADEALRGIADHGQYQAIALPKLVADENVEQLSQIAANGDLADNVRLGAIEGLARMAIPAANEQLVTIGKDEAADEELRKAAWRGLRRAKRMQAKGTKS